MHGPFGKTVNRERFSARGNHAHQRLGLLVDIPEGNVPLLVSSGDEQVGCLRVKSEVRNPLARDLGHIALLQAYLLDLCMRQFLALLALASGGLASTLLERLQEGGVRLWVADRAGKWQRTCQQQWPTQKNRP